MGPTITQKPWAFGQCVHRIDADALRGPRTGADTPERENGSYGLTALFGQFADLAQLGGLLVVHPEAAPQRVAQVGAVHDAGLARPRRPGDHPARVDRPQPGLDPD